MREKLDNILAKQPILIFDGECGFCNRSVQFFLKRERKSAKKINFTSLQSEAGILLREYFEIGPETQSLIFIRDHSAYVKSCAALRLTWYMRGLWPLLLLFLIIPPFLRNMVYDFVAKRRMKWFGRIEHCALLTTEEKKRFIEN
jgi:predicted DCC family thiol-disulfide oxidoreductase YuxK